MITKVYKVYYTENINDVFTEKIIGLFSNFKKAQQEVKRNYNKAIIDVLKSENGEFVAVKEIRLIDDEWKVTDLITDKDEYYNVVD